MYKRRNGQYVIGELYPAALRPKKPLHYYFTNMVSNKSIPPGYPSFNLPIMLADAIRDYEYLSSLPPAAEAQSRINARDLKLVLNDSRDIPESYHSYGTISDASTLTHDSLRDMLRKTLPRRATYSRAEMNDRLDEFLRNKPPEDISPFVDGLARFIMAFVGGAVLIVPVLVMRLPRVTLTKSLVTVSVAVLLFAAAVSIGFRASNTDTLVACAIYAAVLVVFVGTSANDCVKICA